MLRRIIFDLDGTLTDPREGILRSVAYGMERMGRPLEISTELNWLIGPPLQNALGRLLETEDSELINRCLEFFRERFSKTGMYENEVYPGVRELLASLRKQDLDLYVATSKPTTFATQILEHFELATYFTGIYGSELDGSVIRKGDVIRRLLVDESLDGADAMMVGDREHDVLGAREHGIPCIGVLYGYGSRQELLSAGAVAICESPAEVLAPLGL